MIEYFTNPYVLFGLLAVLIGGLLGLMVVMKKKGLRFKPLFPRKKEGASKLSSGKSEDSPRAGDE